MSYFDSNFSVKSVDQRSPFNNLSIVNGLIVPQDMLNDKHIDIEEWEIQAAQILGISGLERGKKYKESYMYKLLHVNETSLMSFYEYLLQHITFPFNALHEEEIAPLEVAEYEVNCICLNQEMKVDEKYGVLIECRVENKKVILPLGSINLDEEHDNYKWIDLYQDWFWSYR